MNAGTRKLALWRHAAAMLFLSILAVLVTILSPVEVPGAAAAPTGGHGGATSAAGEGGGTQQAAGAEEAAGTQEEEPEGIDTTDPEDSGGDGAGTTSWLAFAIIGVLAVGSLVWYLDRLRRGDRGAGESR